MKIIEKNTCDLKVDVYKQNIDNRLTIYDKKKKCLVPCERIDATPFHNKNHCYAFVGACGSGKTTLSVSIYTSLKEKIYVNCYDTVIVCIPEETKHSLGKNSPFKNLEHQYSKFDEQFLSEAYEICEDNASMGKDTLLFIDDGASALRSSKRVSDLFADIVMRHRHLRCSVALMCQDAIQLSPTIRENLSGLFYFKPSNAKRTKLFYDEYMADTLSFEEFIQLCKWLYQKKGDFLYINLQSMPKKFFRNFNEIEFKNTTLSNGEETIEKDESEEKKESC